MARSAGGRGWGWCSGRCHRDLSANSSWSGRGGRSETHAADCFGLSLADAIRGADVEEHPRVQLCGSSTCGCSSVASSTRRWTCAVHGEGVGEADATHGCRVHIYKGCAGLGGGAHVFLFSLNSIRSVVFLGMASCTLSKKGLWEQFVAQTNGGQYVRCSNTECNYFYSLQDLLS